MSPLELLTQLNALDEHSRIEAKSASEVGKSLLETVCAFANEPGLGGGWIALGAKLDDGALYRQYTATGLADPDKIQRDLVSQCATAFNRPIRVQIESGLVNGRNLLAVFVPEVAAAEKPIYFASRPLPSAAYRRQGSSDVQCTEDDLAVFYQDRRGDTYDAMVLRDADLTAIDPAALADYRRIRAELNPGAEELKWSDHELLHALRCATPEGGELRPTAAGVLLFGTAPALRRYFPLMRVDYIRVPGREWVQDPDGRFETVEIRAPLLTLVRRTRAAILDDLPKAFSLPAGEIHRQDIPLVPDRVIREAVVNAVMHRSYRVQGAIQIIRYANRLEIRNPGHSLVAEDRLGEPGSETRNPVLAAVLHETNLAETKGSGIRVMRELMEQSNLTPPTFISDRTRNQFVITCLFHHFLTPEDWTWLRAFGDAELAPEEAKALVYAREMLAIDNATYRHLNRVDVLNASQHLRRLRDRGLLEQKGKGADTYYMPTGRLTDPWHKLQSAGNGSPEAAPEGPPAQPRASLIAPGEATQSSKPVAQSSMEPGQSSMLDPLAAKVASLIAGNPGLPEPLAHDLAALGGKAAADVLEELTYRLCLWRPLAAAELGRLLGRNDDYIHTRVVRPMIQVGRLEMTIPDQPRNPAQRYRATVRLPPAPSAAGGAR
jgi:ATP-dependent DNA helicase RecG